jgi:hypothetical protein
VAPHNSPELASFPFKVRSRLLAQKGTLRRRGFVRLPLSHRAAGSAAEYLGEWLDLLDGRTGMQITAFLRDANDDRIVTERAAHRGVNLAPLSPYHRGAPTMGLVMGYAGVSEDSMEPAFQTLRHVFLETARRPALDIAR